MEQEKLIEILTVQLMAWEYRVFTWRTSWSYKANAKRKVKLLRDLIEALREPIL